MWRKKIEIEIIPSIHGSSPRCGFDRIALVGRPRSGSASRSKYFHPRRNSYCHRSGSASGSIKRPRSGVLQPNFYSLCFRELESSLKIRKIKMPVRLSSTINNEIQSALDISLFFFFYFLLTSINTIGE
jgi:hypothetical protein